MDLMHGPYFLQLTLFGVGTVADYCVQLLGFDAVGVVQGVALSDVGAAFVL